MKILFIIKLRLLGGLDQGISNSFSTRRRCCIDQSWEQRYLTDASPTVNQKMAAPKKIHGIGHSGFGFLSSLVIGHSSFNDFYRPTVPNECEKPKRAFHEAFGSLHHTTE